MNISIPHKITSFIPLTIFAAFTLTYIIRYHATNTSISLQTESESPTKTFTFSDLIVVTRIHSLNAAPLPSPNMVVLRVQDYLNYSASVLVCVDVGENLENVQYISELNHLIMINNNISNRILVLPISPWGRFVTALNSALLKAKELHFKLVCFQSLEFKISSKSVTTLLNKMDSNTFVVGPSLPGHKFTPGVSVVDGRTCPWNTFAIWSVEQLSKFGFLMISDGIIGGDSLSAGVEEVVAINLIQHFNHDLVARLICIKDIEWNTNFEHENRTKYHASKMQTKESRPRKQMEYLRFIENGKVIHEYATT